MRQFKASCSARDIGRETPKRTTWYCNQCAAELSPHSDEVLCPSCFAKQEAANAERDDPEAEYNALMRDLYKNRY